MKVINLKVSRLSRLMLSLAIVISSTALYALPSDVNQPIKLLADKATYKASTGKTTYSGNVIVSQGSLKINADNISLNLSKSRSIERIIASGRPAKLQQIISKAKGKAKGQANKIEFNNLTGILSLTGNAKLTQAGASFSGNQIRYSLSAGDVEVLGSKKKRVELIFPPNGQSNPVAIR